MNTILADVRDVNMFRQVTSLSAHMEVTLLSDYTASELIGSEYTIRFGL